jgi:hypothetical protein
MAQNPLGGFLKGLFGRQTPNPAAQAPVQAPMPRPQAEAQALGVSEQVRGSDAQVTAQPTPLSPQRSPATPTTEAYMTRKKGRKLHRDSYADAKRLYESIQRRGEATPGDLAQEFGMARSSLAYNLNRLVAKKYVERLGGGRSIRYKVTGVPLGRIN